jgi:hypothetical protein
MILEAVQPQVARQVGYCQERVGLPRRRAAAIRLVAVYFLAFERKLHVRLRRCQRNSNP